MLIHVDKVIQIHIFISYARVSFISGGGAKALTIPPSQKQGVDISPPGLMPNAHWTHLLLRLVNCH